MITSWQERFNNKFQHSAIQAGKNSWQVKFMQEEIDELRAEVERLNQPFQPDWVNYRQGKIDGLLVAAEYLFCNKHIDRDTYEAIKAKAEGV
jgi:hypothetical protein